MPIEFRHQAEITGATVVDRASVITTHLAEVVRRNAGRLLSRQDVKMLIDVVKEHDPVVIDELNGANVRPGEIQRVLQICSTKASASATSCASSKSCRSGPADQGHRADRRGRAPALGPAISAAHAATASCR